MFQSRTHTCGELRLANAGEKVTIVGWMENVREVGSTLAFVVLRDFYGTTQVVVENNEEVMKTIKSLNCESTISVTGTVRERSSKNTKIPTGEIEVVPESVEVLGRCIYNELPFEINRSREADENARLRYRFLDLRNPAVKKNIVLRCQVVAALRRSMTEHGFLEITTPILTCSSPEGARDYLVPSRLNPGKFYALPQAPQQFKQLLMTSGFDRYFQIAPCFRDEDLRADRQPERNRRRKAAAIPPAEDGLYDALRSERMRIAQAEGVPAYVVFSNAALADMAARRPRSLAEFLEVSGVGEVKAQRYGEAFLQTIRAFEER